MATSKTVPVFVPLKGEVVSSTDENIFIRRREDGALMVVPARGGFDPKLNIYHAKPICSTEYVPEEQAGMAEPAADEIIPAAPVVSGATSPDFFADDEASEVESTAN